MVAEPQKQDDGSYLVQLEYPLDREKQGPLTEVRVRRPTVGDLEAMDRVDRPVEKTVTLVASLSGLPMGLVRRLDAQDFKSLGKIVESFVEGKTSSGAV